MGKFQQPEVLGKDLKGVSLYVQKPATMQLDFTPFILGYLSLVYRSLQHVYLGTW